jgi:RHS repeat-associated protein
MTYPSGRTVTTGWDRASRVASVQQTAPSSLPPFASQARYAPHGAIRQLQLGSGLWESTTLFNSRLQPRILGLGSTENNLSLLRLEYTYGGGTNNGNVMSQQIQFPGQAAPIVQSYTYDGLNRLGGATESSGWLQTYGYNRFGNRWVLPGSSIPNPALTPTAEGAFDNQTNRLALPNLYDTSGNHTRDTSSPSAHFFTYNGDSLQASYDLSDVPTPNRVSYEYDGEGRRIRRSQAGAFRVFVYDAFGKLAAEYTSGASNAGTGIAYTTPDTLGSVRIVTSGSGAVLARHDFLPFGEEFASSGETGVRPSGAGYGGTDGVRHRFTGKERDNENGLDYFGARYFSGPHGRFTSPDLPHVDQAAGNPQSWNLYAYVRNNPLRYTDPTGRVCVWGLGNTCNSSIPNTMVQGAATGTGALLLNDGLRRAEYMRLASKFSGSEGSAARTVLRIETYSRLSPIGKGITDIALAQRTGQLLNKTPQQLAESASRTSPFINKLGSGSKMLGTVGVVAGAGLAVERIASAPEGQRSEVAAGQTGSLAGGALGGWGGAKIGAAIGTAIEPGGGTVVGAIIGAIAGGAGGSYAGEKGATEAYRKYEERKHEDP